MKIIIILTTVLILVFQSWTKADDIKDFEIEGMSIGDSLLDYMSKDEIIEFDKFYEAEDYHQDYYRLNKSNPYCKFVIKPKLDKFFENNKLNFK